MECLFCYLCLNEPDFSRRDSWVGEHQVSFQAFLCMASPLWFLKPGVGRIPLLGLYFPDFLPAFAFPGGLSAVTVCILWAFSECSSLFLPPTFLLTQYRCSWHYMPCWDEAPQYSVFPLTLAWLSEAIWLFLYHQLAAVTSLHFIVFRFA